MIGQLLTVGDLVLDIIMPVTLPVRGGEHQAPAWRRTEPGGAANTIVTALNLGLAVAVTGTVGDDIYGAAILDPLRARGANLDHVLIMPGSDSTLVLTLTDPVSGEHVFIGHYGGGPEMTYPPGLDATIAQADAVFFSGYSLVEERIRRAVLRALDSAHRAGKPIYMDAGPLLTLADQQQVSWALARTGTLFLTEDETALVAGPQAVHDYAGLLARGPHTLVIKRGARGCTILDASGALDVPAYPVAQIVDTVGAGDAFDAAFIAGRLAGLSPRDCGRLANATGAAAIQKVGAGTNAPTRAEIWQVIAEAGERLEWPC